MNKNRNQEAVTAVTQEPTEPTAEVKANPIDDARATFLDLFKARNHLTQLKQMQFPPKTAVKVWRVLKQLDVDFQPMMQQYELLIVEWGTAVQPGQYQFDDEGVIKINAAMDPLLAEPLTCHIQERLTLNDLEQAEAMLTPALLEAIWFILEM